ncbi:MAG TPA: hypothetical protein VEI48_03335 [Candidatus Sulfotelmatobacter sp.]|nr:hypothetical protein [Candidatus Sulfotelmatobacter sp.]
MDQSPTRPRLPTQQRTRDAALRRLRRLTIGAAVLGTAGTATLGGLAAVTYAGHATATPAAVAEVGAGTSASSTGSGSSAAAAPTATAAPTDQLGSSTVVVQSGSTGSGMVTSGGS